MNRELYFWKTRQKFIDLVKSKTFILRKRCSRIRKIDIQLNEYLNNDSVIQLI
jgi:hypothetical protein